MLVIQSNCNLVNFVILCFVCVIIKKTQRKPTIQEKTVFFDENQNVGYPVIAFLRFHVPFRKYIWSLQNDPLC